MLAGSISSTAAYMISAEEAAIKDTLEQGINCMKWVDKENYTKASLALPKKTTECASQTGHDLLNSINRDIRKFTETLKKDNADRYEKLKHLLKTDNYRVIAIRSKKSLDTIDEEKDN